MALTIVLLRRPAGGGGAGAGAPGSVKCGGGVEGLSGCPRECFGVGTCMVNGTCVCNDGYWGGACRRFNICSPRHRMPRSRMSFHSRNEGSKRLSLSKAWRIQLAAS